MNQDTQSQIVQTYANIGECHTRIKQLQQNIEGLQSQIERSEQDLVALSQKQEAEIRESNIKLAELAQKAKGAEDGKSKKND